MRQSILEGHCGVSLCICVCVHMCVREVKERERLRLKRAWTHSRIVGKNTSKLIRRKIMNESEQREVFLNISGSYFLYNSKYPPGIRNNSPRFKVSSQDHQKSSIQYIREGFHGRDLMVVVGFSGSLAMFWRLFFLMFRQSLWPAKRGQQNLNKKDESVKLNKTWLPALKNATCKRSTNSTQPQGQGITTHKRPANDTHQPQWQIISSP